MTKHFVTDTSLLWEDTTPDFQEEATELVNAVKELNRSVTSLNKALMRLQRRMAHHSEQAQKSDTDKVIH